MSDEVQEELIRQVMQQSGQSVSFAWQGGEPTLLGIDFYQRAIDLQAMATRHPAARRGVERARVTLSRRLRPPERRPGILPSAGGTTTPARRGGTREHPDRQTLQPGRHPPCLPSGGSPAPGPARGEPTERSTA